MSLSLLCWVALFLWGAGEANVLDLSFRTFSYGCQIRHPLGLFVNFFFPYAALGLKMLDSTVGMPWVPWPPLNGLLGLCTPSRRHPQLPNRPDLNRETVRTRH